MIDVEKAIKNVNSKFMKDPLIIHVERDIVSLLYSELLKQEDTTFETAYSLQNQDINLRTNRIHCEYKQIDLVVFSKDHIEEIEHSNKLLYIQDIQEDGMVFCDDIIEVKYENGHNGEKEKVIDDFEKLNKKSQMFYETYNKSPNLHFLYYVFYWKKIQQSTRKKMVKFLLDLAELSVSSQTAVNYHLVIGPRFIWKYLLESNDIIKKYKRFENISINFTI